MIDSIVSGIVERAKSLENNSNITFIKEYKRDFINRNFQGYICVVAVDEIEQYNDCIGSYINGGVKGEMYSVKIRLRVYADNKTKGINLSGIVTEIVKNFKKADEDNIIDSIKVSPITYDNDMQALYREVVLNLEFCLCGEM